MSCCQHTKLRDVHLIGTLPKIEFSVDIEDPNVDCPAELDCAEGCRPCPVSINPNTHTSTQSIMSTTSEQSCSRSASAQTSHHAGEGEDSIMNLALKLMDERNDKGAEEVVRSFKGDQRRTDWRREHEVSCQVYNGWLPHEIRKCQHCKASDAAKSYGADRAHQTWTTHGMIHLIPCRQAAYLCPD